MELTEAELQELLAIARRIGWGAGEILLSLQNSDLQVQNAAGDPVTIADEAANRYILNNLQASLGTRDFAYLSEETYQQQAPEERLNRPLVWVIDPLDGTKDFIQKTGEFAVHIALVQEQRPILAVVACPAMGKLYFATRGGGCFVEKLDGTIASRSVADRSQVEELTVVASRSHRNQRFNQLMQRFPVQKQRAVGSIGGKIAAIVEQQADLYISLSGKSAPKDWDLAAPELILTEAGGCLTRFDGSLLHYNQADVSQWGGLLASNGPCHSFLCEAANRILTELEPAI